MAPSHECLKSDADTVQTDLTKEECTPNRKGFMQLSSPLPVDTGFLMRPSTLDMLQEEKEIGKNKGKLTRRGIQC